MARLSLLNSMIVQDFCRLDRFLAALSSFEFGLRFGTCAAKFDEHFAEKLQLCTAI
jgi:hypothetical protein